MAQPRFRRLTRQRKVILEELRRVASHPTAPGVFALVRRRLPNISLGTVYRNLELMARAGLIRKLEFAGAAARFDGNTQQHDHVRCISCGRVDDLPGPPLELPEGKYVDCLGYQILGYELELVGLCAECRRSGAAQAPEREADPGQPGRAGSGDTRAGGSEAGDSSPGDSPYPGDGRAPDPGIPGPSDE